MAAASLQFVSVSKWYGQVSALTEVGFEVGSGVTGLVGQNGAGKSTLMKLAGGLLRPSIGRVLVCGRSPEEPAARAAIGLCPDQERLYEGMSGLRFVTWMLRLSGRRRGARAAAAELLEQLGLGDAMHRRIGGYSKGMRQRVKLAQAIGHQPSVLLLDEPLTGLDPVARHEIGQLVRDLGGRGVAVLVSSHVLHELQAVADRFVLMHQGRLTAEGGVSELREQLRDRPRRVELQSPTPRALAAQLCAIDDVAGVRVEADRVVVDASGTSVLWGALTEIGSGGLIRELRPIDDDLESVFGYLVT